MIKILINILILIFLTSCSFEESEDEGGLFENHKPVVDTPVDDNVEEVITNTAPIVNDLNPVIVSEDSVNNPIVLLATDLENDILTYTIVTQPSNGTLNCIDENCLYTPNPNYNGGDVFTYKVNDGTVDSIVASVPIVINSVNDLPIANDGSYIILENSTLNPITLSATDIDNPLLTYLIVNQPANGTLACVSEACTYTPNLNYVGLDSFTYKVNDTIDDSNTATITLDVRSNNQAPVSDNLNITVNEDSVDNIITLNAIDGDGDPLTYVVVSQPTNGTVNCTQQNCTYTPNVNYNGLDSFTYKSNDTIDDSNTATVSISVTPINDIPVTTDNSYSFMEDSTNNVIVLTANDVDNDPLTYTVVTQPSNGTLNCTSGNCNYTPNASYSGSDSFTYKVNDGTVDSNTSIINITVNPINDTPVADNFNITVDEDSVDNIVTLVATDADNDPLTYTIVTQPSNGILSCTQENCLYTPNANYFGSDSFTYKANDGIVDSNTATVSITVNNINDAPTTSNNTYNFIENSTDNAIVLTANDVDNDILTYTVVTLPSNGTLNCTQENCTYTPNLNYSGADSFTYKVNDGTIDSNTSTINITITPIVYTVSNTSVTFPSDAIYMENSELIFHVVFPENIIVSNGTPQVVLDIGGVTRYAQYITGSGTSTLQFMYQVQANDADLDGIEISDTLNFNGATLENTVGDSVNPFLNMSATHLTGVIVDNNSNITPADQITSITTAPSAIANTLNVSWNIPNDNGTSIINYSVMYREQGTSTWNEVLPRPTANSTSITGLQYNTNYEIKIATNNGVMSAYSAVQQNIVIYDIMTLNPIAWLDANDPNGDGTLPADGSKIATWVDKTGQADNATQVDPLLQPIIEYNAFNGLPSVRFDNLASGLQGGFTRNVGTNLTIFVVAQYDVGSTDSAIFEFKKGNNRAFFTESNYADDTNGYSATTGSLNMWRIQASDLNVIVSENSTEIFNGVVRYSSDFTGAGTYVLGDDFNSGNMLNGYISEILIFDQNLSGSDITTIETYLNNKWGL